MAIDIVVPVLGESITEGTVAAWLKKEGDPLSVDEPVVDRCGSCTKPPDAGSSRRA